MAKKTKAEKSTRKSRKSRKSNPSRSRSGMSGGLKKALIIGGAVAVTVAGVVLARKYIAPTIPTTV